MAGCAIFKPGQRWKAVLLVVAACTILLAGGVLVGFASGRSKALARQAAEAAANAQAQLNLPLARLPMPNSAAAEQLLSDGTLPDWLRDVYMSQEDAAEITAEHVEGFLNVLQRALQAAPAATMSAASAAASIASLQVPNSQRALLQAVYQPSSFPGVDLGGNARGLKGSSTLDLTPFITASGDFLSYLRFKQSQALLPLIRSYCRNGLQRLSISGLDPAVLRQEVQQLLLHISLQQWYLDAAHSRVGVDGAAAQQNATALVNDDSAGKQNNRRLMGAHGDSSRVPFDLTSTLLSKMQGRHEANQQEATAAAATGLSSRGSAVGSPVTAARTAPVTASISSISAVADPDYLALNLEELGYDYEEGDDTDTADGSSAAAAAGSAEDSAAGVAAPPEEGLEQQQPSAQRGAQVQSNTGGRSKASSRSRGTAPATSSSTSDAQYASSTASPTIAALEQGQVIAQAAAGLDAPPSTVAPLTAAPQAAPQQQAASEVAPGQPLASIWAAPAPTAQTQAVQAGPTDSPKGAVCAVQHFSPFFGMEGLAGGAPVCPAPRLRLTHNGWVFRPITVPVIFHCLTFTRLLPSSPGSAVLGPAGAALQVVLPPDWQISRAAGNLVEQANKAFQYTGIQFRVEDVRRDPAQHAYLQQPSLAAWQSCTYNTAAMAAGVACLRDVAGKAAAGAAPHAIHVFVAGSREEAAYCEASQAGAASTCHTIASGYNHAAGPWTGSRSSSTWREDDPRQNWVFISWDTFSPAVMNSARFANRGGSILATQLSQYLGLKPAAAAADGPPLQQNSCIPPSELPALASWCSRLRQGQQPAKEQLTSITSCPMTALGVLEPSAPDSCAMTFTETQVAALQSATAVYRPKLMQAYASST